MKCRRCNENESTGIMIHLCGPCFDIFEAKTKAAEAAGTKYHLRDDELVYFHGKGEN